MPMSGENTSAINRKTFLKYLIIILCTIAYQIFSMVFEKNVITESPLSNLRDYIPCRLVSAIIVFYLFRGIYNSISGHNHTLLNAVKMAIPYIILVLVEIVAKNPAYAGDEVSLYYEAAALKGTTNHWLYYLTPRFYIVAFMLIPTRLGPLYVKGILESIIAGYVMLRTSSYFSNRIYSRSKGFFGVGSFMIIPLLLLPMFKMSIDVHRMPVYVFLYMLFITILLFDKLEDKRDLGLHKLFWLLLLSVVLTQWRVEGIYWLILGPVLILMTYRNVVVQGSCIKILSVKNVIIGAIFFLFLQYIVQVPQYGFDMKQKDPDVALVRMYPFYAHAIPIMYYNDLNTIENADDLAVIDKYWSLETLDFLHEVYGDFLIVEPLGQDSRRDTATDEDMRQFCLAAKRIIINNPVSFLRAQAKTFDAVSKPAGMIGMAKLQYNLYIPVAILFCLFVITALKGRWFTNFVTVGLLANWFIVFVLSPAAYFKYHAPEYLMAYYFATLLAICAFYNAETGEKRKILT